MKRFDFTDLSHADLVVDATYESNRLVKNVAAEPLAALTGTGNQGTLAIPQRAPPVQSRTTARRSLRECVSAPGSHQSSDGLKISA